ncbi:hypothetical protein PVAND_007026 [Polypedilum vanderplanki]|uniref:Peptidoglycan recognition protein family domain-containing protein n=1 Tax=Polypedilum vanderplanki TaxID=319348 RepID=A0A9J6C6M2_POLVA|nr:hypothetical protein PVAND_007026 [Polypedilum vanderplanki]
MYKNNNNLNLNRCASISTIDSISAAEIVNQAYQKFELDASPIPLSSHNNLMFEKSEKIHVGDVINYYLSSSSIEGSKQRINNNSQKNFENKIDVISNDSDSSRQNIFQKKIFLLITLISFVIITLILISILYIMNYNENLNNTDIEETTSISITSTSTYTLLSTITTTSTNIETTTTITEISPTVPPVITLESYKTRKDWNAEAAKATIALKLPIHRIIIAHTGGESCHNENDCKRIIKRLQENSIDLDDIPYNFLIGDDSNIYEGRGILFQGQHSMNKFATEYDSIGICVAFIGNYEFTALSESQIKAFGYFVKYFIDNGLIIENYTLFSHDQLVKNEKPADKLTEMIKDWKGFRNLQKIFHRDEWKAEEPKTVKRFNHIIDWALLSGNYTPQCYNFSHCAEDVRKIQKNAFNGNLNDIGYAFIIGGDGLIFEGRGWDLLGEHTDGYDNKTIAIHIIDDNIVHPPNDFVMNAIYNLLEDGAALGPGYGLVGAIKKWTHWQYLPKPKRFIN